MNLEVHDTEVLQALDLLLATSEYPRPWLDAIGSALANSARKRFIDSTGPTGAAWAPLSRTTMIMRLRGRSGNFRKDGQTLSAKGHRTAAGGFSPLRDTGRLMNSISYNVGSNYVEYGTNVVYARMQHFGAKMGEFGRYSQVARVRKYGLGTFKGSAGTQKGFPIPWGDVPGRPFLGISVSDRSEIAAILRVAIESTTQLRAAA